MGKRKFLSILLSVCMILAFMPQMAFAAGVGNPYTLKEGTDGAGNNEGPSSLIDGDSGTKWCVTDFESAYIIFSTPSSVEVSGYSITTGNDNKENSGRNPKTWTLYGCNDSSAGRNSTSWMPIHSVMNDVILKDENKSTYKFAFDKEETAYQYYKLEITAIKSGDVMQMSEFAFTDCNHNWGISTSEAPKCITAGYTTRTCRVCNGTDYVYLKPVDHVFSEADGKCINCGHTSDELHQGYVDENGISRKLSDNATPVTDVTTTWTKGGWYIVNSDVTLSNVVTVNDDVKLILADRCSLTVNGNISGGSLTIYGQTNGTGNLTVSGNITSGSGGDAYDECDSGSNGGNITINGGLVKVGCIESGNGGCGGSTSGTYGNGSNGGKGGKITINGGIVEAGSINSGKGGNGGHGYTGGGRGGNGGSITINGGLVKVGNIKSGTGGTGGSRTDGSGSCGSGGNGGGITIHGGIVEAGSITSGSGGNGGTDTSNSSDGNNGFDGPIVINVGTVFQGNSGQVYGARATLNERFTIPADKTLTIGSGKKLIIPDDVTLTNNGTISNGGEIYVDGKLSGTGTCSGSVYYLLTAENASVQGYSTKYNDKTYAKTGDRITCQSVPLAGADFARWSISPNVDINNNSFVMPNNPVTVAAQFEYKPKYEVVFDTDGGSDIAKKTGLKWADKVLADITDPSKTGYIFAGWKYGDGTVLEDTTYSALASDDKVERVTLTAQWTECTHSAGLTHTPEVPSTYTEYGVKDYWTCSTCNMNFSDVAGTTVISDLESWKAGEGKIDKLTIPSKTDSVTSGKDGSVTVTLDKSVSSSGGKTTAKVTDSVANTILTKLASSESKSVVINAAGSNAAAEPGTSTLVTISESAVKKLAEVEGIEITLVTDNGKVVLDSKTLSAVASKAGDDGQVAFIIDTVERGGSILKVELKIQTSGGDVTGFDGGKVTVTVVIDDELRGKKPVCVYIDEEDIYHKIGGMLNDDGTFTFVTGHFSTYAIMPEADADAVIKEQTAVAQKAAIKNVKTTVTLSTKEVKKGIRVTVKVPENKKADKTGIIIYRSTKKDAKPYAVYKKVETKGSTYIVRNYYNVKGNRLVKGKTYYYKARAYKVIDGKTYYGPMSTIKYIKAK